MKKLHEKAMASSKMYADWHREELTELLSWAIFFAMAYMAVSLVTFEADRTVALERQAMQHSAIAASSTR